MQLNEYQERTDRTAIYPEEYGVLYTVSKMTSEAGEALQKLMKAIRDQGWEPGKSLPEQLARDIASEAGDVLWYVAQVASSLGMELEEIADMNLSKLSDRAARGKLGGSGDNR